MGVVEAVCISEKKGMVKKEVNEILLEENWGITGDAHAGIWHRQVSLLAGESIDAVKKKMPNLKHGVFAENIVCRGVDLTALAVGDRLVIDGRVVLEVTQIGKKCHNDGCAIKRATGDCIMPKEGIFTKVIHGGVVTAGLVIEKECNTGSMA
ncbi:MAG: MOSC domain-containing protein [Desulfobulbaceae bacterium]|nr:MOSC domain-containing protein [Desulfobulbaceae bacterium]HIJ90165.1 MOSC domain-containing protein [Deltaproteobacteria bacterium]